MRLPSLHKFLTLLFLSISLLGFAQLVPPKPAVLYPIYDEVDLLTAQEEDLLNKKLISFADSTSTEISVIIIPNTKGEDINYLATMYGEKWQIGEKEQDNGIVFMIAVDDRKFSIQQGRGVERYLTASVAGQILDYIVTPKFRQGKYYEGINGGTSALMEAVQGKFQPIAKENSGGGTSISRILLIIFFVIIILSIMFGNKGGGRGGRYDDDDDVILSRRGRRTYPGGFFPFPGSFGGGGFGGGGFGGGSGGGFGGFGGGGSFGGGGASGGW